jgi:hypothetical protein
MVRGLAAAVLIALLCSLTGGAAAQDADIAPPWSITFQAEPLDVITVQYKDGSAQSFNYFTFTLENKGKVEADLRLHVKAVVGSNPKKRKTHLALPEKDAEEYVRRMSRTKDLKNVQEINAMGKLGVGKKVRGIAVLGTFDREWDIATVTVSGLEPRALHCRVRMYGEAGFTLAHLAYRSHNEKVLVAAGEDAPYREAHAVVRHDILWMMKFFREGDEFSPHLDPIHLERAWWAVAEDPAPEIVLVKGRPFGGE